jgi:hypothetical protein
MWFWFTPVSPIGLHALRVLSGLLFAFWLLTFAGHQTDYFGLAGFLDLQALQEAARLPGGSPTPLGWSILYLAGADPTLINAIYWGSIVVLLLFAAGVFTRITSILTWVIVVSFTFNPVISYDADHLLVVLAFYLMVGFVLFRQWSQPLSPLGRFLGTPEGGVLAWLQRGEKNQDSEPRPSYTANLVLRLLQIHFAVIVMTAGLHKLQYGDWWSGVAFWYPLHPPLETTFQSIRTSYAQGQIYLFVLSVTQYAVLTWQIAFPLFAWRQRWRPVLIGGSVLGWLGCFILGWPLFGPIWVIGSLSYLTPAEWRKVLDWLGQRTQPLLGRFSLVSAGASGKSTKVGT